MWSICGKDPCSRHINRQGTAQLTLEGKSTHSGDSLNWRGQKRCSSHQSRAVRRFSHLCTAESSEEILKPSLTFPSIKGSCRTVLALDPNHPVQIPNWHARKREKLHFVGIWSGAVATICIRAPEQFSVKCKYSLKYPFWISY